MKHSNYHTLLPLLAASVGLLVAAVACSPSLLGRTSTSFSVLMTYTNAVWHSTGSLQNPMGGIGSTVLNDGRVIVHGGWVAGPAFSFTEFFNPSPGIFTLSASDISSVSVGRLRTRMTRLNNGNVLVSGGQAGCPMNVFGSVHFTASTNLYDNGLGLMNNVRLGHTATLLSDGRVMIVGGGTTCGDLGDTIEYFNPTLGQFTLSANVLSVVRSEHTAILLPNGKVLVAGGAGGGSSILEVIDPVADTVTTLGVSMDSLLTTGSSVEATRLSNGKILLTGGMSGQVFDPARAGSLSPVMTMRSSRSHHRQVLLNDGRVLITGGYNGGTVPVASTEIFDPAQGASGAFIDGPSMATARSRHGMEILQDGRVLVVGGNTSPGETATAELFY